MLYAQRWMGVEARGALLLPWHGHGATDCKPTLAFIASRSRLPGLRATLRWTGLALRRPSGVSRWRGPGYLAERAGKMALVRKPEVERHFRKRQSAGCQLTLSFADALAKDVLVRRKSDDLLEKRGEIVRAQPGKARQFRHLEGRVEMCLDMTGYTPNALRGSCEDENTIGVKGGLSVELHFWKTWNCWVRWIAVGPCNASSMFLLSCSFLARASQLICAQSHASNGFKYTPVRVNAEESLNCQATRQAMRELSINDMAHVQLWPPAESGSVPPSSCSRRRNVLDVAPLPSKTVAANVSQGNIQRWHQGEWE